MPARQRRCSTRRSSARSRRAPGRTTSQTPLPSSFGRIAKRNAREFSRAFCPFLEHDAKKCPRHSDDIVLYLFDLDADSDFRPVGLCHQQKMPCNCRIYRASNVLGIKRDQSS
ncbi:hypothetical protein ELH24_18235 [Rhizobium ruizarguesonis]|uniref:Uncharacterized protein n=1 Tax=Rhizobium ruizarguesonis TaxID=2081791 RepID=A0AAE8QG90_9HYPH|nr:hypothetical protein ELH25_21975 [Rhizobium ruizarguesonis]TBD17331.1 hypothetical protein ELH24_18235 [Rhizobium ruizarguesonis]TBE34449.1 hypothetical protein ELH07_18215 [Rhizobium ruizarguesonis]TBE98614.1 hypothetical protein ELG98_19590 [Rhizobium ruizarguesonis]TBF20262.1 hypothetical protein ELG94_18900 [Rhizobium ruizarguesonis]